MEENESDRAARQVESEGLFKKPWKNLQECPNGHSLVLISTAYGWRAICTDEQRRWTWIRGEEAPVEEKYSGITDNTKAGRDAKD